MLRVYLRGIFQALPASWLRPNGHVVSEWSAIRKGSKISLQADPLSAALVICFSGLLAQQ
jgi:hypothetical protein